MSPKSFCLECLFSHPHLNTKVIIVNRPLGRVGRVVSILKFVGRVGLCLLDIGLGQEIWTNVHLWETLAVICDCSTNCHGR